MASGIKHVACTLLLLACWCNKLVARGYCYTCRVQLYMNAENATFCCRSAHVLQQDISCATTHNFQKHSIKKYCVLASICPAGATRGDVQLHTTADTCEKTQCPRGMQIAATCTSWEGWQAIACHAMPVRLDDPAIPAADGIMLRSYWQLTNQLAHTILCCISGVDQQEIPSGSSYTSWNTGKTETTDQRSQQAPDDTHQHHSTTLHPNISQPGTYALQLAPRATPALMAEGVSSKG